MYNVLSVEDITSKTVYSINLWSIAVWVMIESCLAVWTWANHCFSCGRGLAVGIRVPKLEPGVRVSDSKKRDRSKSTESLGRAESVLEIACCSPKTCFLPHPPLLFSYLLFLLVLPLLRFFFSVIIITIIVILISIITQLDPFPIPQSPDTWVWLRDKVKAKGMWAVRSLPQAVHGLWQVPPSPSADGRGRTAEEAEVPELWHRGNPAA